MGSLIEKRARLRGPALVAATTLLLLLTVAFVISRSLSQVIYCDRFSPTLLADAQETAAPRNTPGPHWHETKPGSGCWTFSGSPRDEDAPAP